METRKAKTHKGRKVLDRKRGIIKEGPKSILFIRGGKTNEVVTGCIKDLVNTIWQK